jgi:hypothetical protein
VTVTRRYLVLNPKTREQLAAALVPRSAHGLWHTLHLFYADESRYLALGQAGLVARDAHGYMGIHTGIIPELKGQGFGAALYLVGAVAAGDLKFGGIESTPGPAARSDYATRLWERFKKAGLARRDPDGFDRLDAEVAFATGLVVRAGGGLGRLDNRLGGARIGNLRRRPRRARLRV